MNAIVMLSLFAVSHFAHANLGSDIGSQCSVSALNLQSNARNIAEGRLVEARQIQEYFSQTTASRSEVTADRESLNHYRMQVKVEGVKYAQNKCILDLIEKRVGGTSRVSKLKDTPEGRKVLAEFEDYAKTAKTKLNDIREKLKACEKQKDKRECQLKAYAEEVELHAPLALLEDLQKAGKVGFIDGRQDVLGTYRENRLQAIRDMIKEMNDTLTSSGDRFTPAPESAEGQR